MTRSAVLISCGRKFNMSGQPAMSVPHAWNKAGLPLGMIFSARLGGEATLFRLAGHSSRHGRGKTDCHRYARKHAVSRPKLSLIRAQGRDVGAATGDTDTADGVQIRRLNRGKQRSD
jgi:ribosomal protein S14